MSSFCLGGFNFSGSNAVATPVVNFSSGSSSTPGLFTSE